MRKTYSINDGFGENQKQWLLAAFLVLCGLAGRLHAEQSDLDHIDALRIEQSYAEIDEYCQKRLAAAELSEAESVDLTVAWLRASTQRAIEAPSQERSANWKRLVEIIASSERIQRSPRGILIRIQLALSGLSRAETLLQETATSSAANDNLKTARSILRTAIGKLRSLDKKLEELLLSMYKKSTSDARASGWTKTELEALRRNLAVQLSRAYRYQALCYPASSPDRINSLGLALQSLADLTKSSSNESVVWESRIEQLACLRLLKRFTDARQLLKQWQSAEPSPGIVSRLDSESLKLDFAERTNADIDPLMQAAANLYTADKPLKAVEAYDRAAEKFAVTGKENRRFEAAQTAAAIVRATDNHKAASERFRQLALKQPKHAEAAAAHLVATGLAASLAREADDAARPAAMQRYGSLLQEHLRLWPQSEEAATARLWLRRYRMSPKALDLQKAAALATSGKRNEALDIYRKLMDLHAENGEIHESYVILLSQSKIEEDLREALQVWQQIEKQSKPAGPRWLRARQARLELLNRLGKGGQAEKLWQLTKLLYPQTAASLEAPLPSRTP